MRCGEAAASDFLYRTGQPCDDDVLAGGDKFDEVAGAVEQRTGRETSGKINRHDAREMAGPFAFHEILIVARRHNVASAKISFIDPIFVMQDVIFAATTKAAIKNVIATFEREPHAFPNDERARAKLFT